MRASRALALFTTSVVVVAFALGGWVPLGRTTEQRRPSTVPPKHTIDPGRAQEEKAGVDIDAVVDKVRHRVTPAGDGSLSAHDEQYRARFGTEGFGFTLGDQPSGLGVSLRRVQRGSTDIGLSPAAWIGEANVAVRGIGSGMTERVTARAGELEWDVVLDRPLPGTGDLRIEAALRGLDGSPARIADGAAWRFPLGDGGAARMGEVVVKDATDDELHRALPQVRGEVVYLEVPASVLADARYPLTVDPTVGPEQPVGDPVYGNAFRDQSAPAVAWNGTDFLVVWQDERRDPNSGFSDIYAARVSGAGSVLDPEGIAISTAPNGQGNPAVAWNGTDFLVVWADQRVCCESGFYQNDIYAARVSGAGSVLDPAGIPVSADTDNLSNQSAPAVAWNGTNFLVVWEEGSFGAIDIYGARVSGAGSVLDPGGIPVSTAVNDQRAPALARAGNVFLVVWQDARSGSYDIYEARVHSGGSVLDPAGIPVSTAANNQLAPAVAWNTVEYLVVWQDFRSGTDFDIYGARVTGGGGVGSNSIPVSTAIDDQLAPAVTRLGSSSLNFLVVWEDHRSGSPDIYGTRAVSGGGPVLDPAGIPVSTAINDQGTPALASNGTDLLVVWADHRSGAFSDIYGARVSGAGSVLDPAGIALSTQPNTQRVPAVAWNGTDFLVVWEDGRGPSIDIYGARISGTGTVLDPAGIPIATTADHELTPEVAWNGTDFLVVWQDFTVNNKDIYAARVSAAGSVLDPGGIPVSIATTGHYPAVASSGSDFLVVWQKAGPSGPSGNDIYGARVTSAGTVLDPAGIPVSTATGGQAGATVAWNGTDFLVVWQDHRSGAFSDIYGSRVSSAGTVLDPAGIPVSTAADNQLSPAVASWGDNFFVVWQDRRSGSLDIYGAGVGANGTVAQAAGIPISTAAGDQTAPDLAVRYHFLVAWRDRRSGTNHDIYATRVRPSGVVEEPAGVLVSSAATDEGAPAVTGGPGATWGVAYDRMLTDSPFEPARAFLRSVSPK